ncbi:nucleotidyltransferase family protein [uncultured Thiodictyon sp.]|jgi:hypothetical protein|uniref:nucleotidyltransferase domain-containing protein n=1 Tax=uncultured Thiodictyon sp. TaxID=1846217 RepID=UPI0025DD4A79|nr:nucleotidyltransferase family protein [uncultured Thiodictyon sp.]
MSSHESAALTAWRQPTSVRRFTAEQWTDALWGAGQHRCLARLSYRIEDAGCANACPEPAWDLLTSARYYPNFLQVRVAREIRHLHRILRARGIDFVLLKGGAYLSAGFPFARGRGMNDLDLMVRRSALGEAEAALRAAGLVTATLNDYDQHYYRTWMHEIPPLHHPERGVEVDVHHRILPLTSRLNPAPEIMWADAVALPATPGVAILSPPDMLLHTATHLFYDGAILDGFRDLLDIDSLIATHAIAPDYWSRLLGRAASLELGRPLYYALYFARRILATPIPTATMEEAHARFAPGALVRPVMEHLVTRVLPPRPRAARAAPVSAWLLYLRSHWLRMPPGLLARHLGRKGLRRFASDSPAADWPPP